MQDAEMPHGCLVTAVGVHADEANKARLLGRRRVKVDMSYREFDLQFEEEK